MKKLAMALALLLIACAFSACDKPHNPFMEYENYYTKTFDKDKELLRLEVKDLSGKVFYEYEAFDLIFKYIGDGVFTNGIHTGTNSTFVDYLSVQEGKVSRFYNPILEGNGIVCMVEFGYDPLTHDPEEPMLYNLIVYKMFPDETGENEVIHTETFEGAFPQSLEPSYIINNASFWSKNMLLITYVLSFDSWNEKTMLVHIPYYE